METKVETSSGDSFLKRRHIMVFVIFMACVTMLAQRFIVSFALVAMVDATSSHSNNISITECPDVRRTIISENKKNGEFSWNSELQGWILSSTYIGFCITQLPAGILIRRFGVKKYALANSIIGAVTNLLSPVAARTSPYFLLALHLIKGLGNGLTPSTLALVSARWFPKNEKGLLSTFLFAGFPFGAFIGSVVSGPVCELELDGGWPFVFYIFGLLGVLTSILIIFFYVESPETDPNITEQELKYILENTNFEAGSKLQPIPWKDILTSFPTYSLIISLLGVYWMMFYLLTVHPFFMDTILNIPVKQNGLLASGPQLVQAIASLATCLFSFWINKNDVSKINLARKGCNSLAVALFLIGIGGMYFSGCHYTWNEFFLFFTAAAPALGFGGSSLVAVDMSPTYCGPLIGLSSTIASMSGFIIPVVTGKLTKYEQTMAQWHKMFLINAIVAAISGAVFLLWGSTEIQPYDPACRKEKKAEFQHEAGAPYTSTHL